MTDKDRPPARVPRATLERQIAGALKAAIDSHGPITLKNVSSAAKRIIAVLKDHNFVG